MLLELITRIREKFLNRVIFVTKVLHNFVFLSLIIFLITPNFVQAEESAQSIGFFVTNESCCGEDSDPHAVHGIEVPGEGIVLAGKFSDLGNSNDGFVIKFPMIMEAGRENVWLLPDEDLSYDWVFSFGSKGVEDVANAAVFLNDFVFVAGLLSSKEGTLDRYLAKIEFSTGELLWQKTFRSEDKNKDSAFESALITDKNGLILTGVTNAERHSIEGFKSYGNPTDGNVFVMYFEEEQLLAKTPPKKPVWEKNIKDSLTGKTIIQNVEEQTFIIASSTREEPAIAKIIKIDQNGNLVWSTDYPHHGEVTDISISSKNGSIDGYFMYGHKSTNDNGIDGSITKISTNGDIIWTNTYGNPAWEKNNLSNLGKGSKKFIYDECWGIESLNDGGAIMGCGTGTHCEEFEENREFYAQCIRDPRETWRSLLIRVDEYGKLIWQSVDSFVEENEVITTASEYVIMSQEGKIISVLDLAFGFGLQLYELQ